MSDEEDYEADLGIISTTTDNDMLKSERQCAPRGTTPLLEMDQRHARVPDIYLHNSSVGLSVDRSEEYYALRARGATKLMCETFKLEYSPAAGIVAWADQTLFNEFSGPGMKHGDSWKICLGRCLELDEDDIDGSAFIEDLLEDAMLFPLAHSDELGHWETVLDPGLLRTWVTRPKCLPADAAEPHDDEDDSIWKIKRWRDFEIAAAQEENGDEVAVLRNEYDDSDPEDEGMEVDPDWCMAPHGRDAPYAEDNENEDEPEIVVLPDAEVQEEDLRASTETLGEEGDTEDAELGTDSADSDFDSEEELSGDEGLLEHARSISFW
ncbi:hypothetical protein BV25DRAFT_1826124 [Artomyces pyxidatus]|uniref:Uncharacterized protein n=1 Tax=Artomyces pyxidatus TaxID=48021 RepID=A0ACB8T146_9AGAM|nr:hypothetical protein BV25DRAFT_1826124 [Artomyces pyxidatus]